MEHTQKISQPLPNENHKKYPTAPKVNLLLFWLLALFQAGLVSREMELFFSTSTINRRKKSPEMSKRRRARGDGRTGDLVVFVVLFVNVRVSSGFLGRVRAGCVARLCASADVVLGTLNASCAVSLCVSMGAASEALGVCHVLRSCVSRAMGSICVHWTNH